MSKVAWSSLLAVLVITAGSAYYYLQHRTVEPPLPTPTVVETPALPNAAPSRDEEMKRRKLEGIGNTRELKPVQIPLGNAK